MDKKLPKSTGKKDSTIKKDLKLSLFDNIDFKKPNVQNLPDLETKKETDKTIKTKKQNEQTPNFLELSKSITSSIKNLFNENKKTNNNFQTQEKSSVFDTKFITNPSNYKITNENITSINNPSVVKTNNIEKVPFDKTETNQYIMGNKLFSLLKEKAIEKIQNEPTKNLILESKNDVFDTKFSYYNNNNESLKNNFTSITNPNYSNLTTRKQSLQNTKNQFIKNQTDFKNTSTLIDTGTASNQVFNAQRNYGDKNTFLTPSDSSKDQKQLSISFKPATEPDLFNERIELQHEKNTFLNNKTDSKINSISNKSFSELNPLSLSDNVSFNTNNNSSLESPLNIKSSINNTTNKFIQPANKSKSSITINKEKSPTFQKAGNINYIQFPGSDFKIPSFFEGTEKMGSSVTVEGKPGIPSLIEVGKTQTGQPMKETVSIKPTSDNIPKVNAQDLIKTAVNSTTSMKPSYSPNVDKSDSRKNLPVPPAMTGTMSNQRSSSGSQTTVIKTMDTFKKVSIETYMLPLWRRVLG